MTRIKGAGILLFASLLLFGVVFLSSAQAQQSASLSFSPGSGSFAVGQTFTTSVKVNSGGGVGINAGEAQLTFDKSKLKVQSIGKAGSIFGLWPSEPSFSNADGSVTFAGGSPSAYTGASGTILVITFKATATGAAEVMYTSGSVLAADGKGTNILGESRKAVYSIGGSAPPTTKPKTSSRPIGGREKPGLPVVESPTHSDVNAYYPENDVELRWSLPVGIIGIASAFDSLPDTALATGSEGIAENTLIEDSEDGIWYFHLRFQNANGWGPVLHRRVLIDTKPPNPFDVVAVQDRPTDPTPRLAFLASDELSGVSRYEIRVGARDAIVLTPQDIAGIGGYEFSLEKDEQLAPGDHTITVTAYDGAGNERVVSVKATVAPIPVPAITGYSDIVNEGGVFFVEGVGPGRGRIVIRLKNTDTGEDIEAEVIADADGKWFFIDRVIPRGEYELQAKAFDSDGAQSNFSDPLKVTVKRASIFVTFGWVIMLLLLLGSGAFFALWFVEKRKHEDELDQIKEEVKELRSRLRDVFSALHEEADEQTRSFDKRPSLSEREKKILDHLEEALEISEELIGKEVADIEKLLE